MRGRHIFSAAFVCRVKINVVKKAQKRDFFLCWKWEKRSHLTSSVCAINVLFPYKNWDFFPGSFQENPDFGKIMIKILFQGIYAWQKYIKYLLTILFLYLPQKMRLTSIIHLISYDSNPSHKSGFLVLFMKYFESTSLLIT